jgi:hypothetical protein
MADFDSIAETLRRHRKDLDDAMEQSQRGETESILQKIEDLRRRAEESRRHFIEPPAKK